MDQSGGSTGDGQPVTTATEQGPEQHLRESRGPFTTNSIYSQVHRDFPGGPVVKTSPPNAGVEVSISGQELRSHMPCGKKKKKKTRNQKQNCNKFNKDFKNSPHQKTNAHTLML